MKFTLSLITLLSAMIFAFSCSNKTNEVTIDGQLSNVEDGAVLSLFEMNGGMIQAFVSDTLKDGSFHLSYTDSVPGVKKIGLMAQTPDFPPTYLTIWVEPGTNVKITGNDKLLRTWNVESPIAEQKEQNKYTAHNEAYHRQKQEIMINAYARFEGMRQSPEKAWEFRRQIDSLYAKGDSLEAIIERNEMDMLKQNPTHSLHWISLLSDHSMNLRYRSDYPYKEELLALYGQLAQDKKDSESGKLIALNLFPPTAVKEGDEMADADLFDLEGNIKHLADYKGKYILLDFWSAGCGPCLMAMPEMGEIADMYKDKLTLVSISSDTKDAWEAVSKEKNITWPNLNDFQGNNGLFLRYGIKGIPNYVLISPDGTILKSWMGYGEGSLKEKMKELIK